MTWSSQSPTALGNQQHGEKSDHNKNNNDHNINHHINNKSDHNKSEDGLIIMIINKMMNKSAWIRSFYWIMYLDLGSLSV